MDDLEIILTLLLCCFIVSLNGEINCNMEPKCFIGKTHGFKSADCYRKDLRWFPQCLSSNVEIIDLSENRLRKLSGDELKKYSSLKMLYLSDNMIQSIDEDTFDHADLATLDLSLNGITKLPRVIFNLPSLKSLYLRQNINMNLAEIVEEAKPITSPLVHFDISYIYEEPNALPDMGIMPHLVKYNISGNAISSLSAFHFAGLCNLHILDTDNSTALFTSPCECHVINRWLSVRKVKFTPFPCELPDTNECEEEVDAGNVQIYSECEAIRIAEQHNSRTIKILIGVSAALGVLFLCCLIYFIRKRKRKHVQIRNTHEAGEMLSSSYCKE